MVELMMKHQQEFPLSILHQTRSDSQPKVRHTVDQMVELRMKHQQEFPLFIHLKSEPRSSPGSE
jgi:hypothetical protein